MKVKRIIIATSLVVTFAIICAMSAMALQNSNKINNSQIASASWTPAR